MLHHPSPLHGILNMPWDVDRHLTKNTDLPRKTIFSKSKPISDPLLPSRLFTIPLDILEHLLDRLTKKDAFRLSQTCRTFMWHPVVLKAVFYEPISLAEIEDWYRESPDGEIDKELTMGPPITRGINAYTGPLVRCLALPEWISEQDLHYLTVHCPNLDTVDFTQIFENVPRIKGQRSGQGPDEDDDDGNENEEDISYWPSILDQCPALFKTLKSVHLPYGCWKTVYSRLYRYQQPRIAGLPKALSLAQHLQILAISCRQDSNQGTSPDTRRKASAKLLGEILKYVSRGLTTLALYQSESTIDNLESFVQSLSVFPKLRTIKLSLHSDLYIYQKFSHHGYDFHSIIDPIWSSPDKNYEHDTASARQYLAIIKKISDRGRFSLMSSDSGEHFQCLPREYYGLCQSELVLGPRDDLWAPVWTWNDRLDWVRSHMHNRLVETVDIERCRDLFEELAKARIPITIELKPLRVSSGALFTDPWVHWEDAVNAHNKCISRQWRSGAFAPVSCNTRQRPKQHFIQRRALSMPRSKKHFPYYHTPIGFDNIDLDPALFSDELSYNDYQDRPASHPLALAVRTSLIEMAQQKKQCGEIANSNVNSYISESASHSIDPRTEIPNPIWRMNKIGDLVDNLRLIWDQRFAHVYTRFFASHCDPNLDWTKWSEVMHKRKTHLRDRLWREAEFTALLFRRIPVDYPRLTRLALYIPAALYPNHDQTFINHALPGTGWTVSHYGKHHDSIGHPRLPGMHIDDACAESAIDFCPFVRRIFTRPTPTDDPSAVIVHNDDWHMTRRPVIDLDGEYKSMEQLLTEPLRENYTMGEG